MASATRPAAETQPPQSIEALDSDGDGYSNKIEMMPYDSRAMRMTTQAKYRHPIRCFPEQLEGLPQHTQLLLMNAHKSTDFYAEYAGSPWKTC